MCALLTEMNFTYTRCNFEPRRSTVVYMRTKKVYIHRMTCLTIHFLSPTLLIEHSDWWADLQLIILVLIYLMQPMNLSISDFWCTLVCSSAVRFIIIWGCHFAVFQITYFLHVVYLCSTLLFSASSSKLPINCE